MAEHMYSSMGDKKVPNGSKVVRINDRGDFEEISKKRRCVQLQERPQSADACNDAGSSRQRFKTEAEKRKPLERNQNYTKEQLEFVQRILKCENLYDVLEVPKNASESDIKKAFKKLALLVHPDKNRAPNANQAMQMVAAAGDILVDAAKRRQYDLEEEKRQNGNEVFHSKDTRGLGIDAGTVATGLLIILGSVLLYHGVKAVINYFKSEPDKEESHYSFKQSNIYPVKRMTYDLKIPYYVKRSFRNDYEGPLWQLEIFIEEEYKKRCGR